MHLCLQELEAFGAGIAAGATYWRWGHARLVAWWWRITRGTGCT